MNKLIIIICLLITACIFLFAKSPQMLLASYSTQGIYYYYIPHFDINKFKKPEEVQMVDSRYIIFIYDKEISTNEFAYRNKIKIENTPDFLYDMILIGIEKQPTHFINRTINQNGATEVNVCEFKKDDWQIKYMLNQQTNKFEKQIIFNNGKLGVTSICNPNYVPFQDI